MKTITLIILLGFSGAASAGYKEAEGAIKNPAALDQTELDALLLRPGAALAGDARTAELLNGNQQAMELFRQAAEEPNEGYLFGPKPEKYSSKTQVYKFGALTKVLKLLLLDAKIKAAQKQPGPSERNLLAVTGFILQLSAQKSPVFTSTIVQQVYLNKAYPVLAASLQNPSVSPAYLKEIAARLEKMYKNHDFLREAILGEAEMLKGLFQEAINPESVVAHFAQLSFLQRVGLKKLQDQAFFSKAYADYNAAVDAHAAVLLTGFRANDPAPVTAFIAKRQQEILARKQAREKRSTFDGVIDGLKGGPKAKNELADMLVDDMLSNTASYEKLIPHYHLYLSELNVLRAALAVKLYQRGARRLPAGLDQLVPFLLPAVPQDPFCKFAPLGYLKTGKKFLVYGCGPDGKDDSGAAALDTEAYYNNTASAAGDLVFSD